jgi:hypothetical protein
MGYRIIQTIEATCDACGAHVTSFCDSVADGKMELRREGWIISKGVGSGRGKFTAHGEANGEAKCYCSRDCRRAAG